MSQIDECFLPFLWILYIVQNWLISTSVYNSLGISSVPALLDVLCHYFWIHLLKSQRGLHKEECHVFSFSEDRGLQAALYITKGVSTWKSCAQVCWSTHLHTLNMVTLHVLFPIFSHMEVLLNCKPYIKHAWRRVAWALLHHSHPPQLYRPCEALGNERPRNSWNSRVLRRRKRVAWDRGSCNSAQR